LNVDRVITDGLVKCIWHHDAKGQPSKDVQNVPDATLTAACFAMPGEEASLHNIASRILGTADASGKLTGRKNKAFLLQKTFFTVTGRKFSYATMLGRIWKNACWCREHLHTVFTDRINVPHMDHIDGTLKVHMVLGTWECREQLLVVLGEDELPNNMTVKTFKLKIASMPCVCIACRREANQATCIFEEIRNE
jgi:hypothetical protein